VELSAGFFPSLGLLRVSIYMLFLHPQSGIKKIPHHPVCVMSAGYWSGWTGEAIGNVDLVSVEVMCIARGKLPDHAPFAKNTQKILLSALSAL